MSRQYEAKKLFSRHWTHRRAIVQRDEEEVLILTKYGESVWGKDWRWTRLRDVEQAVRGSIHIRLSERRRWSYIFF